MAGAGTGAAIVLATGRLEKDGVVFNAFAVGIHDGTDAKYGLTGGKEYLMIARGTAANGAETYYDNGRILPYTEIAGDPDLEADVRGSHARRADGSAGEMRNIRWPGPRA